MYTKPRQYKETRHIELSKEDQARVKGIEPAVPGRQVLPWCTACGKDKGNDPEDLKYRMCPRCRETRNSSMNRANRLKKLNLCSICGKQPRYKKQYHCISCLREKNRRLPPNERINYGFGKD